MNTAIPFILPASLNASTPPERRGLRRDHVRLMVSDKYSGNSIHTQFYYVSQFLNAGDVLVLNNSRTVPAVLQANWFRTGTKIGSGVEIRLAHRLDEETWDALVVARGIQLGDCFHFSPLLRGEVTQIFTSLPLVRIHFSLKGAELIQQIYDLGEPVRYEYIQHPWKLDYYQNVYATEPGSVELVSAGRAFSWEMLFQLKSKGIHIAFLTLHTGLSYYLDDRFKLRPEDNWEEYHIPNETACLVNQAKRSGRRVIAVGTTVVRALESATGMDGTCAAKKDWTCLHIDSGTKLKIVDGLMTGFHEPEASHLDLLSAFVDSQVLKKMYQEAVNHRYLWHEFGDIHLIL